MCFLIITLIEMDEVKSVTNENDLSTQKNIITSNIKRIEPFYCVFLLRQQTPAAKVFFLDQNFKCITLLLHFLSGSVFLVTSTSRLFCITSLCVVDLLIEGLVLSLTDTPFTNSLCTYQGPRTYSFLDYSSILWSVQQYSWLNVLTHLPPYTSCLSWSATLCYMPPRWKREQTKNLQIKKTTHIFLLW